MRALPTHPPSINPGGKAGDSALVPTVSACQSTVCLQSSASDLLLPTPPAFRDPRGATFLPTCSSQSLVQPWPKGTESSARSLQQAHLLPFAHPSQLQSSAVISRCQCGAVHRNLHRALSDRDTLRAGGSHGLWGCWCPALGLPASWAAPVSHLAIWLLPCC